MAGNTTRFPYKMRTHPDVKRGIDNIIDQLERGGRAISPNPKASRTFSHSMRDNINQKRIIFGRGGPSNSLVMLPPGYKLVRKSSGRIKIVYENDQGRL